MGCCISKCKPPQFNPDVQDKLAISHSPPPSPSPPLKSLQTVPQSPPSSAASFTCSTQTTTYDSSSLSTASSSSSIAFSKLDRTFSNDFLQSCAIENAQIIGLDHPVKKIGGVKQLGCPGNNTHKRARAGSPTLITRQKSFRVEKQRLPCSTVMRSPSPSRRFNANTTSSCVHRRQPMKTHNESNRTIKASRPASPNRNVISKERPMRSFGGYEIDSKGEEDVEIGKVLSRMSYSGYGAATEDLDNPHIALDCFIFL